MRKMIWILCLSNFALAVDRPCPDFESKCVALTDVQDKDILRLKGQVKELESDLLSQKTSLPFYVWFGAGILAGGLGTLILSK
jgi:hypothetical protein